MDERLIELVRVYPVLYDTNDGSYMKTKFKQEIWKKIGKELKMTDDTGEEAKSAWKKLRNNHRDALRRRKRMTKSGAAAADIKPWKFETQMEFLLRYMVNDNRETNFTVESENTEDLGIPEQLNDSLQENQDQEHLDDDEQTVDGLDVPPQQPQPQQNNTTAEEQTTSTNTPENAYFFKPPPVKKPKVLKRGDIDNLIIKSLEKREMRAEERKKERKAVEKKLVPSNDDLHLFFMSMYELTKKMPRSSQHVVRKNVFFAVSQEEERLVSIQDSSAPSHFAQLHPPPMHSPNCQSGSEQQNNCWWQQEMSSNSSSTSSMDAPLFN